MTITILVVAGIWTDDRPLEIHEPAHLTTCPHAPSRPFHSVQHLVTPLLITDIIAYIYNVLISANNINFYQLTEIVTYEPRKGVEQLLRALQGTHMNVGRCIMYTSSWNEG